MNFKITFICTESICSGSNVRIVNRGSGHYFNGNSVIVGHVEICVNGSYALICQNALSQDVLEYVSYRNQYRTSK